MDLINKRKDVFLENKAIREENEATRKAYRAELADKVVEHKTVFLDRINAALDKMTDSKIERLLGKLEQIEDRVSKMNLSEEKADEINSKIIALKEILEEKLELNTSEEDELDINGLLGL